MHNAILLLLPRLQTHNIPTINTKNQPLMRKHCLKYKQKKELNLQMDKKVS